MTYTDMPHATRTITGFFDTAADADVAVGRLVAAGIPRSEITVVRGTDYGASHEGRGFWEALKDFFLPDDDRELYAEGLRRGGYLVTVKTSDTLYHKALEILDEEGAIDIDERAASWRSEGWAGYDLEDRSPSLWATGASDHSLHGHGDETVIPVAEEEIKIGKRDVSHGRVRVRSYVVETPVEESVELREEHVRVERRPVDRPLTAADDLFHDRTIEVEERAEEAVVSKEARVREELVVHKDVEHYTDHVSDTVRRTEVEVEDERGETIKSRDRF